MTEIIKRCMSLSYEQRKELLLFLQDSVAEDGYERFKALCRIAKDVVGDGILSNSREFNCVMGRRMIAYQMRKEGCSLTFIGKCLNKNHATILHMTRSMDDILQLPKMFKLEITYWNMFQKRISDYEINEGTNKDS